MSYTIYVRMKNPGKKERKDLTPVPFDLYQKPETVRELLVSLTKLCVEQYNARRDEGQLLAYLTKEDITDQAARGKISFGLQHGADADPETAVKNTIQCFEDGIYRVFAGDTELTTLAEPIPWTENLIFTFVRLTMLSGIFPLG